MASKDLRDIGRAVIAIAIGIALFTYFQMDAIHWPATLGVAAIGLLMSGIADLIDARRLKQRIDAADAFLGGEEE